MTNNHDAHPNEHIFVYNIHFEFCAKCEVLWSAKFYGHFCLHGQWPLIATHIAAKCHIVLIRVLLIICCEIDFVAEFQKVKCGARNTHTFVFWAHIRNLKLMITVYA